MALEYSRVSSQYDETTGRLVERWLVWDKAGTATEGPEGVLVNLRVNPLGEVFGNKATDMEVMLRHERPTLVLRPRTCIEE